MSDYNDNRVGRVAMQLALTLDREEENRMKEYYIQQGYQVMATGTGGDINSIGPKINNAVTGAALSEQIIEKTDKDLHAVIHATLEAKEGFLLKIPTGANIVVKISAARKDNWLAVAMYGYSAMHSTTNHERAGLGIMHL